MTSTVVALSSRPVLQGHPSCSLTGTCSGFNIGVLPNDCPTDKDSWMAAKVVLKVQIQDGDGVLYKGKISQVDIVEEEQ